MGSLRVERDLKVEDQLGCCCRAEGNECLNWGAGNGEGEKMSCVRHAHESAETEAAEPRYWLIGCRK